MLRYRLRTLLILLALLPPLLWIGWGKYEVWRAERERKRALQQVNVNVILTTPKPAMPMVKPEPMTSAEFEAAIEAARLAEGSDGTVRTEPSSEPLTQPHPVKPAELP